MKPSWLLLALLVPASLALGQQARIHRCLGENGEPTFSDRRCSGPGPGAEAATAESAAAADPSVPPPREAVATQTCARSPEDLRGRVATAFAAKNGVGLSGLFLWDGFGQGSAMAPLRELASLIAEPLISVDIEAYARLRDRDRYYDPIHDSREDAPLELVIRTLAEQERRVPYEATSRFGLVESAGCWWLQLPY